MNTRHDEGYYRGLLEAAQKGIENGKEFLEAIGKSEAALNNAPLKRMAVSTTTRLEQLNDEFDQLWDLFKRIPSGAG